MNRKILVLVLPGSRVKYITSYRSRKNLYGPLESPENVRVSEEHTLRSTQVHHLPQNGGLRQQRRSRMKFVTGGGRSLVGVYKTVEDTSSENDFRTFTDSTCYRVLFCLLFNFTLSVVTCKGIGEGGILKRVVNGKDNPRGHDGIPTPKSEGGRENRVEESKT